MKHQQVNVDFWAMAKSMLMYGVLTAAGWMMLRLFNAIFSLPRRMRLQQDNIQTSLQELQKRYPKLNITEEDLRLAEKEVEEWSKEPNEFSFNDQPSTSEATEPNPVVKEDKKSI